MSTSRPTRCMLSIPKTYHRLRCHSFHTTPNLHGRRRSRFRNLSLKEIQAKGGKQLLAGDPQDAFAPYDTAGLAKLKENYTAEQRSAIEASERSILPSDLMKQARFRTDAGLPEYLDDYAITVPGLDREPDEPFELKPPRYDFHEAILQEVPQALRDYSVRLGHELRERKRRRKAGEKVAKLNRGDHVLGRFQAMDVHEGSTAIAPEIDRVTVDEDGKQKEQRKSQKELLAEEAREARDPGGKLAKAAKEMNLSEEATKQLKMKVLHHKMVVNVTMLGRVQSTYVLAMAGTGNGRLGLAQAKGLDFRETVRMAKLRAIKAMKPIPRYEDRTIYGDSEAKVSATVVKLMARPPGFGLRCQHFIFELARAAGIQDLAARVPRSRNPMNTIKAAYEALLNQRLPEQVALGRGRKLVDIRKVYYAGRT